MSLTLATRHFDQINDLISGKIPHLDFQLVERAVCEDPNNGWVELIPYSSVSCYDPNSGDIKFLGYQTHQAGEDDLVPQLTSTSVGFGSTVWTEDAVYCTSMEGEGLDRVYRMSATDLLHSGLDLCKRQWIADIGFDPIEESGIDPNETIRFSFFRHADDSEEASTKFGLDIPVLVSPEYMAEALQKCKLVEGRDLKEFVLCAGQILMSFDVSEVGSSVIRRMAEEHKVDPWSVQVISRRLLEYVEIVRSSVSYSDIIEAVKRNITAMKAEMEAAQQKALEMQEDDTHKEDEASEEEGASQTTQQ